MGLLDKVNFPADLKAFSADELAALAEEIRQLIIAVVSRTGGHLSSNLGVVELTLALHQTFQAPQDKIIWDIGHQCNPHKIVTGRKARMFAIRQKNGLLGFPDAGESEYDVVNTGHASTALGFASGLAIARDRAGQDFHIIAVVGDGALTGGMALEALNHIGQVKQRLIIVLNDNKMSISPNVGGISKHLNYLASGRPYIRMKEVVQHVLRSIPGIGKPMADIAKKIEVLMRTMLVPGSLFDELGIKYIGPINGHDVRALIKEFSEAKKYDFPVLLHVATRKGEGYSPASRDPSSFHSSAPFNIQNGKFIHRSEAPSYSQVFGRTVRKLVESDRRIVALTAAMPEGTGLDAVQKDFPDNFFDVGIAEQYMFTFAAGLALGGMKPMVGVYSTFLQRAVDQIIHDLVLMKLPVVVGIDRAGLVGGDGPTHQGLFDICLLRNLPQVVLMAPKDENEMQHMIYTASRLKQPVFIRYPKEPGQGAALDPEFREITLGQSEQLRDGPDAVILAIGTLVARALQAAEKLHAEDGIDVAVLNVRFLKPLDREAIVRLVREKQRVITVEDGARDGGFATMVQEIMMADGCGDIPLLTLGVPEEIVTVASRAELLHQYDLDAEGIRRRTRAFLRGESNHGNDR